MSNHHDLNVALVLGIVAAVIVIGTAVAVILTR
jgi:hypothetical protein